MPFSTYRTIQVCLLSVRHAHAITVSFATVYGLAGPPEETFRLPAALGNVTNDQNSLQNFNKALWMVVKVRIPRHVGSIMFD